MSTEKRRVVITGAGLITAVANDLASNWDALLSGISGTDTITSFDPSRLEVRLAAEVKNFDPADYLDKKEVRRTDRFCQFALVAAAEALRTAGLGESPDVESDRFGVITGSGIGGIGTLEQQHLVYLEKGPDRVSPFFVPMFIADMAPGLISMKYGAKGPNYSTQSACASSAHAIGNAFKLIQRGIADVIISGGTESSVTPLTMAGFASMKALSSRNDEPEKASRPFDANRDGFVLGEGGGLVVLEALEHARARGAPIMAEVVGYGLTADAHHMTAPAPEGEGAQRAMRQALEDGGLQPEDIDYINAHGTSTPFNDLSETQAIKKVFGDHAHELVVSSTKSMTGHTLGAAGGVEGVICTLVVKEGKIPPTINFSEPDPDCDLNYSFNEATERPVELALSNSFGFGGHNVTLAIKRWEE
ncbi:MAG: beta-ketoacyl-ACP synthase II [Gemmatimonadetes bacterium]|uniref:3-oxoacyl-[acyl-carrier-protein] synthase 2 n=1 Tax=Candidatus Kutchimonas denitrificans TaxID=3056748 RepID=A0AAE4Z9X2_9BACT|nr:beta-ketoacyl-ACP synthase II [Gemmatimonadota bacterium]NIR75232.1 beta-ketoacyl-ACP synthase II [Candidatus Kutchimonas denitrificans]NIS00170.1 beta-ketoacyl-ACP synthase II [Gemmatimonadota bacterium]NIT65762.1 beta-ketoacyl-ACP synthase II [Gemmatimonadota bacterium]NIU53040.1 beta-ketoacyl-ACP synthase II [Gemmatimonadota bacterium]